MTQAVTALSRGHNLFAGNTSDAGITSLSTHAHSDGLPNTAAARSLQSAEQLRRSADTDQALARVTATARADRAYAKSATRRVLDDALADSMPAADTPTGRREAMTRMAARLRAQHRHIVDAHRRARLLALRLRRLRYHQMPATRIDKSGRGAVLKAIRKALDIKGIHDPAARARWERGMDLVARRESNYDARAVNNWDSNAVRGTPSKGAWQFIAPTFAAYHQPGTSHDIHNLLAQACAFINYAMGRYGVAADASNLADLIQQADPRRSPKGY
ncbi:MAG: transglycosylase [Mycobacterium sp.]|uniref:transglycosylase SLT domain-containing protein n=1 Tax=Mycobacterium sp. TaxID=1785 RepID=UPI001ED5006A|nr:transglycosylase [Mycobacterium sp.]MBV8789991.1 transglycosylase [Mycobacterium sp.]